MQIAFDVTIAADSEPAWPGSHQWWHTHTEPPPMHYTARPVLERLFGVQPEG